MTHGQYRFGTNNNSTKDEDKYADDWTGKISKISNTVGAGTDLGLVRDVVKNLPRSVRDHLTNQPSFGPDGALYIPQGSNSATGAADTTWGDRPERLLNAAVLRLDPTKIAGGTTLDAKTAAGGTYDPYAPNAPLTIYASGVRNAYDLIWTNDGDLYAPANGSAAGGNTPAGGGVPAITGAGNQRDWLFKVEPGKYYGHPNPTRNQYVLNAGYTPADGVAPNETPEYHTTVQPDADYGGYAYDFGYNVSPNGVIQYANASAFSGNLAGKLIVVRYSGPDDAIVLTRDVNGDIVQAQKGIAGLGGFADPLDIIEDPTTGFLYVSEYSEADPAKRRITLLRPIAPGAHVEANKRRLVFTDIQNASPAGSAATAAQTVTIRNAGTAPLSIPAGGVSIVGPDATQFEAVNWPTLPATIAVGDSISFQVRFRATSTGVKDATLRIVSNDIATPQLDVALRGIGTTSESSGDVGGSHEPSLQRILNAFQIPIVVGDANGEQTYDLPTPRPSGTVTDEVEMQRLEKAGAGPVRIDPLAEYAFNTKTGAAARVGYYVPGTKDARTELFAVDWTERTSTNPTWGATFDPGDDAFALYGAFNGNIFEVNGLPRGVYSEDAFNDFDAVNKRKVRFFPLKDADGGVEPNAYVFAFEEFNAGYDSNDIVGIIRNVRPAGGTGPEIGTENLDRNALSPTRLSFNRIQQQPPDPKDNGDGTTTQPPDNVVHDQATVRIHNSGDATLTIGSVALSAPAYFQLVNPPTAGTTIAPGAAVDVTVKFIAASGRLRNGTLTINSDDADEPATAVDLVGYWQNKSEDNQEPTLPEFMQLFGYGTQITYDGEVLSVPGQGGKVSRAGDEVLSPFWRRADSAAAVEVVQVAAFHSQGNTATVKWHYQPSNTLTTIFTHAGVDGQSILPHLNGSATALAAGVFKPATQGGDTNPAFGFNVDGEWSNDTKNVQEQPGGGYGHHLRFWMARKADGTIIPGAYVMGMDYLGINYDYQDNLYLIRNVKPTSPPSAPANVTALASGGGIALDWDDAVEANLAGYNVYRGSSAGFTPASDNRLNASGLLSASELNDIFAPIATPAFYKVTSVDTSGNESAAASVSATRPADNTPPAVPSNLIAGDSIAGITLDWGDNIESDFAGYNVFRAGAADGTFDRINAAGLLSDSTFVDSTAERGVRYFYRVVSADQNNNVSAPATIDAMHTTAAAVSVTDASVEEPTAGQAQTTFAITLDVPARNAVTVAYATADATAIAGTDYVAASGTVTFAVGETSKTVDVAILADGPMLEPDETFLLNLTVQSGDALLADGEGIATIAGSGTVPDDPDPGMPIGFGGKTKATFTGTDGKPVRLTLAGGGAGTVTVQEDGRALVTLSETTAKSTLVLAGNATLAGVVVNGPLKALVGKAADLTGNLSVAGSIRTLRLRNASGGGTLTVGEGATTTIVLGRVADVSVRSAAPLSLVRASEWLNADGSPDTIAAPSLGAVAIKGDLSAGLDAGAVRSVTVGGNLAGSAIRSATGIGSVTARAMRDSRIFAGVRDGLDELPSAAADMTADVMIRRVTVTGRDADAFSNTLIAASEIGALSLRSVETNNDGVRFGVAAGALNVAAARTGADPLRLRRLSEPQESAVVGDFTVRML